jgi:hypothetical protein
VGADAPPDHVGLVGADRCRVLDVARPSGAKVTSQMPGWPWTRCTRSAGGNAGGDSRSAAMNSGSIAKNAFRVVGESRRNSRLNPASASNVGTR